MKVNTGPVATHPKTGVTSQGRKARERASRSAAEKLVCRYCGSDDLAPSFKRRRDARCCACFKKRYGWPARQKKLRTVGRRGLRSSFAAGNQPNRGRAPQMGPALAHLMEVNRCIASACS